MSVLNIVLVTFSCLGALDRIFGSRFGLGREFDRAFHLMGTMMLSMIGMIVLAPAIGALLRPLFDLFYELLGIDPSILPASLFANDMGGASLSLEVAQSELLGSFNAYVVSSMMGCVISFTIPFATGIVHPSQHREMFLGFLYGIVTVPLGCAAAGLVAGIAPLPLLLDLLPLLLLSGIISAGLLLFPALSVRIFVWLGRLMTVGITVGLALSIIGFRLGDPLLPELDTLENGAWICLSAAVTLSGAFPLMLLVGRLLRRPMAALGRRLGVNATSALALIPTLVTSATAFGMMRDMDKKGVVLNSAFAVSAAFVFGSHLGFTMAFDETMILPMIVGKLSAGVSALVLALFLYRGQGAAAEAK